MGVVLTGSQVKQINASDKRLRRWFEALVALVTRDASYYQGSPSLNRHYRARPSTRATFIRVYTPRDTKRRRQFYCTGQEITPHSRPNNRT